MKDLYGIGKDEYENLLREQGGVCAICNNPPSGKAKNKHLHVDHNHKTGEVRGLLCSHCNAGLGAFREDRQVILKAIDYLNRWDPNRPA